MQNTILFIAIVLSVNIVTCFIYRIFARGVKFIPVQKPSLATSYKTTYIISGLRSRTPRAFDFLIKSRRLRGRVIYVEYKNSGLSPAKAARTIRDDIVKKHYGMVTIISASMGYYISDLLSRDEELRKATSLRQIALCPCLGKESLQPQIQQRAKWLWLGRVTTTLLGWLALLPCVKDFHGERSYSLALLMDQYKICFRPMRAADSRVNTAILCQDDEVLDNQVVERQLRWSFTRTVPGKHADFATHGDAYLCALSLEPFL